MAKLIAIDLIKQASGAYIKMLPNLFKHNWLLFLALAIGTAMLTYLRPEGLVVNEDFDAGITYSSFYYTNTFLIDTLLTSTPYVIAVFMLMGYCFNYIVKGYDRPIGWWGVYLNTRLLKMLGGAILYLLAIGLLSLPWLIPMILGQEYYIPMIFNLQSPIEILANITNTTPIESTFVVFEIISIIALLALLARPKLKITLIAAALSLVWPLSIYLGYELEMPLILDPEFVENTIQLFANPVLISIQSIAAIAILYISLRLFTLLPYCFLNDKIALFQPYRQTKGKAFAILRLYTALIIPYLVIFTAITVMAFQILQWDNHLLNIISATLAIIIIPALHVFHMVLVAIAYKAIVRDRE